MCSNSPLREFVSQVDKCDTQEGTRILSISCNTTTPTLITANGTILRDYHGGVPITKFLYSHSGVSSILAVLFFMICMGQLTAFAYMTASKNRRTHQTVAVAMDDMEFKLSQMKKHYNSVLSSSGSIEYSATSSAKFHAIRVTPCVVTIRHHDPEHVSNSTS